MKFFWFLYSLICLSLAVYLGIHYRLANDISSISAKLNYSPLPSFLNLNANAQVTTLDIWHPQEQTFPANFSDLPQITAKSAISYDLLTDQLLFSKNDRQVRPMASLTKIMTAIVSLEHPKRIDKYEVSQQALVGEDSMGLDKREIMTQKELLYGIFLNSGNDAAEVLAENYPGGRNVFINAMNAKAQALGLSDTHFTNPTGLEGDGLQHTTALDMLVITRYALINFPEIDEVGATYSQVLSQTPNHKEYDLVNETNLLSTYPGVQGLKTGYTPEAGLCLVTYLKYKNHSIIAVILGSDNRREDMIEILDYSLKRLNIVPPPHT